MKNTQGRKVILSQRRERDVIEKLAISVARHLRAALALPATANEHACGYGTICVTGSPIIESLWLQCVDDQPERALIEAEQDSAHIPRREGVPRLPMIPHRGKGTTISLMTRMWVLDELRWLAQSDSTDPQRTLLDTTLSKLNHGMMVVIIHLSDLINLLREATRRGSMST